MTRKVIGAPTELRELDTKRLTSKIKYIAFHKTNGDHDLVDDPTKWVMKDYQNRK